MREKKGGMELKGRWCVGDDGGTKREKIKGNDGKEGKERGQQRRLEERKGKSRDEI